jgi:phosphatidate cytidylyltransferase
MLKQRVITALILVAVLLAFLFAPAVASILFFTAVVTAAAWEWAGLASLVGNSRLLYALAVAILIGLAWTLLTNNGQFDALAVRQVLGWGCAGWAVMLLWVMGYPGSAAIWGGVGRRAVLGLAVLLPAWVGLAYLRLETAGPWLILYVIALVACADVGAYFTGRAFGKRKMAPSVSPGKTLEGLAGGIATVSVFALLVSLFALPDSATTGAFLFLSMVAGLASVLGDLVESMVKRHRGVKDSGTLLPGHGGIMDRIDSLAAAIPVFALGVAIMHTQGAV